MNSLAGLCGRALVSLRRRDSFPFSRPCGIGERPFQISDNMPVSFLGFRACWDATAAAGDTASQRGGGVGSMLRRAG